MLERGREGLGACRKCVVIIFSSTIKSFGSPSLVTDAQSGGGPGLERLWGSSARPQAVRRKSVWALNKLDIAAGHPGERAESPGAVLAPPGTRKGPAGGTPERPEPAAALHSRRRCGAAGEAQRPCLMASPTHLPRLHRLLLEVGSPFLSPATGMEPISGQKNPRISQLQAQTKCLRRMEGGGAGPCPSSCLPLHDASLSAPCPAP